MEKIKFLFVEPEINVPDSECLQPASYIRRKFYLREKPFKAILYTTGLGVYTPYINGKEAETAKLMPGFTNYHKRVQYFETDVTHLLQEGENVVAAVLGDGWYRGSLGAFSQRCFYGNKIMFAATLKVETSSGVEWIFTDEETKATQDGSIRGNDLKTYEIVDMTKEKIGWSTSVYDDSTWHSCTVGCYDGEIIRMQGYRVLEHEHFAPEILITPNGDTVLDFGQNIAGHVAFTVTGKSGIRLMLEMGETLDEYGNFTVKNLSSIDPVEVCEGMKVPKDVLGQTLVYITKEGTQTYKSMFLQSGFRYVRLTGWPEAVRPENFTAIAVYADMPYEGAFRCSDENINQFVNNVRWSQKSNFVDIPTDCPTRERAGWAGDVNVYVESACYLAEIKEFLRKWLQDFISLQKDDGSLPFIAPEVPLTTEGVDMMNLPYSSAGWSDALIHVPMVLYRFYGDRELLEIVYDAAVKYMDFNKQRAKNRHKLHFYKIGKHYQYILDTGYHWGEWLEPGTSMASAAIRALAFPDSEVATAWFYHSAKELAEMAKILNHKDDQKRFDELASHIKDAYRKEFLRFGRAHGKRQCRYVRPVSMGLAEGKCARNTVKKLNKMCIKNGYRIGTGFLSTWQVLNVLTDYGYSETAYNMLIQEECPGWMYEIKQGATTVWENWMGIDENHVPKDSQNHYAVGATVAWLFSRVGGIRPITPGFETVLINPQPVAGLTWAETEYNSIQGKISTYWERKDKEFILKLTVPSGINAIITMPDGSEHKVKESTEIRCRL